MSPINWKKPNSVLIALSLLSSLFLNCGKKKIDLDSSLQVAAGITVEKPRFIQGMEFWNSSYLKGGGQEKHDGVCSITFLSEHIFATAAHCIIRSDASENEIPLRRLLLRLENSSSKITYQPSAYCINQNFVNLYSDLNTPPGLTLAAAPDSDGGGKPFNTKLAEAAQYDLALMYSSVGLSVLKGEKTFSENQQQDGIDKYLPRFEKALKVMEDIEEVVHKETNSDGTLSDKGKSAYNALQNYCPSFYFDQKELSEEQQRNLPPEGSYARQALERDLVMDQYGLLSIKPLTSVSPFDVYGISGLGSGIGSNNQTYRAGQTLFTDASLYPEAGILLATIPSNRVRTQSNQGNDAPRSFSILESGDSGAPVVKCIQNSTNQNMPNCSKGDIQGINSLFLQEPAADGNFYNVFVDTAGPVACALRRKAIKYFTSYLKWTKEDISKREAGDHEPNKTAVPTCISGSKGSFDEDIKITNYNFQNKISEIAKKGGNIIFEWSEGGDIAVESLPTSQLSEYAGFFSKLGNNGLACTITTVKYKDAIYKITPSHCVTAENKNQLCDQPSCTEIDGKNSDKDIFIVKQNNQSQAAINIITESSFSPDANPYVFIGMDPTESSNSLYGPPKAQRGGTNTQALIVETGSPSFIKSHKFSTLAGYSGSIIGLGEGANLSAYCMHLGSSGNTNKCLALDSVLSMLISSPTPPQAQTEPATVIKPEEIAALPPPAETPPTGTQQTNLVTKCNEKLNGLTNNSFALTSANNKFKCDPSGYTGCKYRDQPYKTYAELPATAQGFINKSSSTSYTVLSVANANPSSTDPLNPELKVWVCLHLGGESTGWVWVGKEPTVIKTYWP